VEEKGLCSMTLYFARQFLFRVATLHEQQSHTFSREEIVKRINEIKYLSSHKKIPKLTLRKEIIHLEQKLHRIFDLEEELKKVKKEDSAKVKLLKKEIAFLRQRLTMVEDKELQKKVEKMSYLLGDLLAKKGTDEDVMFTEKVLHEKKLIEKVKLKKLSEPKQKLQLFEHKLSLLKQLLEGRKKEGANVDILQKMELQIQFVENKIKELKGEKVEIKEEYVPLSEMPSSVQQRHTVLFSLDLPKETEVQLERELPLPPPPRITNKS